MLVRSNGEVEEGDEAVVLVWRVAQNNVVAGRQERLAGRAGRHSAVSEGALTDGLCRLSMGLPVGDGAVGPVGLAGFADGGVEVRRLLGLALGFVHVAAGAEAAGVFGVQHEVASRGHWGGGQLNGRCT